MNVFVTYRFECELFTRGSQVAFFVKVPSQSFDGGTAKLGDVVVGQQCIDAEVKLSPRYQVWVRDVLLEDHCFVLSEVLLVY